MGVRPLKRQSRREAATQSHGTFGSAGLPVGFFGGGVLAFVACYVVLMGRPPERMARFVLRRRMEARARETT
jgi:hypothetical protein